MIKEEIDILVHNYFDKEGYSFYENYEHRLDPTSSAMLYSLIRNFKPSQGFSIGTWEGGSVSLIVAALMKNKKEDYVDFSFACSELLEDKKLDTINHCYEKNGLIPVIMGDITKNLRYVPTSLDFLFVDTDHDLKTTQWIFKYIIPKVKKGSLVVFHDWAVKEENGKLVGKGPNGKGGWPETDYMIDLWNKKRLPFKKLYWNYEDNHALETAVWVKV